MTTSLTPAADQLAEPHFQLLLDPAPRPQLHNGPRAVQDEDEEEDFVFDDYDDEEDDEIFDDEDEFEDEETFDDEEEDEDL